MGPAFLLLAMGCLGQADKGINPATAAAKARQDLVRTVEIRFTRTDVEQPGSRSAVLPAGFASVTAKGVPQEETSSTSKNRVVLDGRKMRFECNHPMWNMSTGKLEPSPRVAVDNEALGKLFFSTGVAGDGKPMGRIHPPADRMELSEATLNPILFTFRGGDRDICPYPLGAFKRTGVSVPFGADPCEEYSQVRGQSTVAVWLDPAMDYVVRRLTKHKGNQLLHQMDCQYRKEEKWGWICASWTIQEYGPDGNLLRTERVEVTDARFGAAIPAGEFDLTFPAGAHLYDAMANKYYQVADNGDLAETNARWEPMGNALVPQPDNSFVERHKFLLAALAALAGVLLLVAFRKYSARRSAPQN